MTEKKLADYLYTWNTPAAERLKRVRIDDDIRDGTQGAFGRRPTLEERKQLVDLTAKVGTYCVVLGFPFISPKEFEECQALIEHIEARGYNMVPIFLARTLISDLEPIVALKKNSRLDVRAEMFLGTSPLRREVEQWDFEEMLARIGEAGAYLNQQGLRFGISAEDATRTPPSDLGQVIDAVAAVAATSFTICDTVGEVTPEGAAKITTFTRQRLAQAGSPDMEVVWHGHNDKGLSVANALAAAAAGADVISGTFFGIGERAGNTPLEQVIMLLHQAGNEKYNLQHLQEYCEAFAAITETPILQMSPLVGKQAFATSAGTHSAAILKARKLGRDFEDYVFSSVPASKLGRQQDVVINATSGMVNARYMLEQIGIDATDELAQSLLAHAKQQDRWLSAADIRMYLEQARVAA